MRRISAIVIFCLTLAGTGLASAYQITIDGSKTVPAGNSFFVDVDFSRQGGFYALGSYQLNVLYNPTLMSFTGYTQGSALGSTVQVVNSTSGINLAEVSLIPATDAFWGTQPDAFTLATLEFRCLGSGTSIIMIDSAYTFQDQYANLLAVDIGPVATITQERAPVPEPSTVLLLCGGIVASFAARRMKRG